MSGFDSF